jgi:hypothetical protein
VNAAMKMLALGDWGRLFAAQITHRFPLEQANEALMTVRDWRAGKTVLLP